MFSSGLVGRLEQEAELVAVEQTVGHVLNPDHHIRYPALQTLSSQSAIDRAQIRVLMSALAAYVDNCGQSGLSDIAAVQFVWIMSCARAGYDLR